MGKLSGLTIDGKGLIQSVEAIIDIVKYRKYAREGYATILYFNKENTNVKIMDGKINSKGAISVKGLKVSHLMAKVYSLQTKKLVTKLCMVKEDMVPTIDLQVSDNSHITPKLLDRYEEVKLMDEMKSFDLGQVLLGAMAGLVLGGIGMMFFIMMYNSMA